MEKVAVRWLVFLLVSLCLPALAQEENASGRLFPPMPMNEQVLEIPADPQRPVTLKVTLFAPSGPGPFPLAVLLHGAPSNGHPHSLERYRATFLADYFLSRGFAVALPMMRGFGDSGGEAEKHGCDLAAAALANARDVSAVIDNLAGQPQIDRSRLVVAGQSFGGWNALGFGALGHAGLRGIINFAGGIRESDCYTQDSSLASAAAELGAQSPLPSIWFYGDNDREFPRETWEAMHSRFVAAGGKSQLVAYGDFMEDAHQMLSHLEGIPIWTPKVDAFLAKLGLPSREIYPGYMPTPFPPPTHYADINDVEKLPYLTDKSRASYQNFLQRPFIRVFVTSPSGTSVTTNGGFDPIARALALCQKYASGCQLYAIDNDVVWTGSKSTDSRTAEGPLIRKVVQADVPTMLDFSYGVNPDCSSRGVPKLWVTQAPQHGAAVIARREDFPHFPPAHPYAICNGRKVPGAALTYRPVNGFRGSDYLAFEEINLDKLGERFRVALTVR